MLTMCRNNDDLFGHEVIKIHLIVNNFNEIKLQLFLMMYHVINALVIYNLFRTIVYVCTQISNCL